MVTQLQRFVFPTLWPFHFEPVDNVAWEDGDAVGPPSPSRASDLLYLDAVVDLLEFANEVLLDY